MRPGYKQTEVGVIPDEWSVPRLDSLGSGTSPAIKAGPFGSSLTKDQYVAEGFKVYGQEQVIRGDYLFGDYFITAQKYRELESCAVRPGDVLLSLVGTAGKLLEIPDDAPPGVINPRLLRCSFDQSKVLAKFFRYQFESGLVQSRLSRQAQGGTMGVLNAGALRPFQIPLPPLPEQRAIAAALSDVDALLGGLDRLIAKKRDLKRAAMQQLLTGQTRLPGFHGEWEVKRLGDIADPAERWSFTGGPFGSNLKSSDYTDDGVRIIQLQNIGDGKFLDDYKIFTSEGKADELISCNIYPGEIILSKMGDPVARACIIPPIQRRYVMCSDGIRLAVDQKRFCTHFVYALINAPAFRDSAANAGTGSTRKRIGLSELRSLELKCPVLTEQTAIAAVLADMDAELFALEARRDKTRALKQAMMQELLTGRTRLV